MQARVTDLRASVIKGATPLGHQFADWIDPQFLDSMFTSMRSRHFDNPSVFWAWIAQTLEGSASLSKGLGLIQSWARASGRKPPSGDTGGYCKGRQRLGEPFLEAVHARLCSQMRARAASANLWRGLRVLSIDGSSVQLDDTPQNQRAFPQPSSQKPGCGFPVMGIMGVYDPTHGGWEEVVCAPLSTHDSSLCATLLPCFRQGDVV